MIIEKASWQNDCPFTSWTAPHRCTGRNTKPFTITPFTHNWSSLGKHYTTEILKIFTWSKCICGRSKIRQSSTGIIQSTLINWTKQIKEDRRQLFPSFCEIHSKLWISISLYSFECVHSYPKGGPRIHKTQLIQPHVCGKPLTMKCNGRIASKNKDLINEIIFTAGICPHLDD